jgi:hypothetical protein
MKAFRDLGYDSYSCDIQNCSGGSEKYHITGDVINYLDCGWDLMIAHPPCTYLSKAGARWLYQGGELNQNRFGLGLTAKKFFLLLLKAEIERIAVENPTPLKIFELPKPTQVIQPYMFGHPYSKRTLLWLKNLPKLHPTNTLIEYTPFMPSNTGGKKRGQSAHSGTARNPKQASRTFDGVAKAMALQWGRILDSAGEGRCLLWPKKIKIVGIKTKKKKIKIVGIKTKKKKIKIVGIKTKKKKIKILGIKKRGGSLPN